MTDFQKLSPVESDEGVVLDISVTQAPSVLLDYKYMLWRQISQNLTNA